MKDWATLTPAMVERLHAEGGLRNSTRIRKIKSLPGDGHVDGALGRVRGSAVAAEYHTILYFVEWDDLPGVVVGITAERIEPVE